MTSRESCIEKLEQFVLDENRIVTYKVLSQELKMHTNIAKQYLADFFSIQKSKNVSLQVTYFLAGITEIDGRKVMKVLVVSHNNLEKMKALFSEVTSCHVYSISKNKQDECSLLITERHCNSNIGEINKYSAIKHPTVETKPPVLKKISVANNDTKSSMPKKQEPAPSKNGGSSFFQKNSNSSQTEKTNIENGKTGNTSEAKPLEKKDNSEKPKVDLKGQKSNPLASMWQKKEDKQKDNKSENSKPEAKGKTKSPAGNAKTAVAKNNIMSMFSKQAAKNSMNPKKESVTPPISNKETETVTLKEELEDSPDESQNNKGNKNKKPTKKASAKRKSNSRQSRKSKQNSDNESDDVLPKKKKHRRICTFEDSDSESENEEAQDRAQRSLLESEDPLESAKMKSSPMLISDEEEPIPPTPPVVLPTKGKKKIWKTMQKTFQDEDGFFVTKQQKELVSASESDEEDPPKNKTSKENKPNQFTYRKQSSLTSFFK